MVKCVGVDIQRSDLERRLERAWDSCEDYIPEQQPENSVDDPSFRMQPIPYNMSRASPR